jgi:transcriptional regulator with XRE-family HTH domain
MQITPGMSDYATLKEIGRRVEQLRLVRNISQQALAEHAGVGRRTLQRIEAGASVQVGSLLRVLRSLGLMANLDGLVPPATPSPVALLALKGRERKRASTPRTPRSSHERAWRWGDEAETPKRQ